MKNQFLLNNIDLKTRDDAMMSFVARGALALMTCHDGGCDRFETIAAATGNGLFAYTTNKHEIITKN